MIKTTNNIATIKNSYRVICDNSQALYLIEDKITKNEIRKKYISNISIEIDELINQRLFDLLSQEYELFSKKLITKSKMYRDCSDARSTARNGVLNYDELFSLINRIEECCKD